jgi:hypothetical protein
MCSVRVIEREHGLVVVDERRYAPKTRPQQLSPRHRIGCIVTSTFGLP